MSQISKQGAAIVRQNVERPLRVMWEHIESEGLSEKCKDAYYHIFKFLDEVDTWENIVTCCHSCNQSKAHSPWKEWYLSQDFFSMDKYNKIIEWMKPEPAKNLFLYKPRKNNVS